MLIDRLQWIVRIDNSRLFSAVARGCGWDDGSQLRDEIRKHSRGSIPTNAFFAASETDQNDVRLIAAPTARPTCVSLASKGYVYNMAGGCWGCSHIDVYVDNKGFLWIDSEEMD